MHAPIPLLPPTTTDVVMAGMVPVIAPAIRQRYEMRGGRSSRERVLGSGLGESPSERDDPVYMPLQAQSLRLTGEGMTMSTTLSEPTYRQDPTEVAPGTYVIHEVQHALGQPLSVYINSAVILAGATRPHRHWFASQPTQLVRRCVRLG